MKACVCVDYLSHEWSSTDLIQAHRELQRQKSKTQFNIITKQQTASKKELKKLSVERVRQIRYQNTIWRQMARSCTKKLSWSNQMIHPSSVNWQKESDITWLYGPLYMPPESSSDLNTHPSLSFLSPSPLSANNITPTSITAPTAKSKSSSSQAALKPALKRNIPSTSNIMLQKDYWLTNDRYWSKCVSESGKQSVRFSPNITEVKFLPETPVKESFKKKQPTSYFDLDSEGEDEEERDDEEIWKVIVQVGSYLKCVLFSSLFGTLEATTATTKQVIKKSTITISNNQNHLIQFCVSAVSFTAWIMYQTFSTIINHTPFVTTIKAQNQVKSTRLLERKNKNNALIV